MLLSCINVTSMHLTDHTRLHLCIWQILCYFYVFCRCYTLHLRIWQTIQCNVYVFGRCCNVTV